MAGMRRAAQGIHDPAVQVLQRRESRLVQPIHIRRIGEPAEAKSQAANAAMGLGEGAAPDVVAAWVMIGAEAVRQVEVREIYAGIVQEELILLTRLFADCLQSCGAESTSAPGWAAGMMALIEGAFQLSSAARSVMPRGYAARAAVVFAKGAIRDAVARN